MDFSQIRWIRIKPLVHDQNASSEEKVKEIVWSNVLHKLSTIDHISSLSDTFVIVVENSIILKKIEYIIPTDAIAYQKIEEQLKSPMKITKIASCNIAWILSFVKYYDILLCKPGLYNTDLTQTTPFNCISSGIKEQKISPGYFTQTFISVLVSLSTKTQLLHLNSARELFNARCLVFTGSCV